MREQLCFRHEGDFSVKPTLKEAFNIPNILCYIRILLIPFFSYFLLTGSDEKPIHYYIAAGLILLSGLTDMLDGWIARHFNMITEFGKVIDPVADKLTQFMIAVCLAIKVKYIFILVAIVFIKEICMGICCLILLKRNKKLDGAMWFGKVATFVFYASMFLIIAFPTMDQWIVALLITIVSVFVLFSFGRYLPVFYRMGKKEKNK